METIVCRCERSANAKNKPMKKQEPTALLKPEEAKAFTEAIKPEWKHEKCTELHTTEEEKKKEMNVQQQILLANERIGKEIFVKSMDIKRYFNDRCSKSIAKFDVYEEMLQLRLEAIKNIPKEDMTKAVAIALGITGLMARFGAICSQPIRQIGVKPFPVGGVVHVEIDHNSPYKP